MDPDFLKSVTECILTAIRAVVSAIADIIMLIG